MMLNVPRLLGLAIRVILFLLCCFSLCFFESSVQAQDMEARAYSNAPIGTNFFGGSYSYSRGGVAINTTLPISDINAGIHGYTLGGARFFSLAGRTANFGLALPYIDADINGNVGEERESISRIGMADARFRLAVNLIGGPALTPKEFAQRTPATTLGISTTVVAPTGEYTSEHLINIGANRWAFKPDLGVSVPLGDWFIEGSGGVWLFTDNNNFFGGKGRSQDPIESFQLHAGYNFRPGIWLAGDATYWMGGASTVEGVKNDDRQSSSRYGLTFSTMVTRELSVKIAASNGLATRIGGNFETIMLSLQYRWFDS